MQLIPTGGAAIVVFSTLTAPPVVGCSVVKLALLHIGKGLLLELLGEGEIPAFRVGRLWRVYKKDLISYMEQR